MTRLTYCSPVRVHRISELMVSATVLRVWPFGGVRPPRCPPHCGPRLVSNRHTADGDFHTYYGLQASLSELRLDRLLTSAQSPGMLPYRELPNGRTPNRSPRVRT